MNLVYCLVSNFNLNFHFISTDDDLKRRKVSYTDNFGKTLNLVENQAVSFY